MRQRALARFRSSISCVTGARSCAWLPAVAGVLDTWYPGQTSGTALASVLFGQTDPGGHLPVTFPASLSQVPASTTAQFPGNGSTATATTGGWLREAGANVTVSG